MKAWRTYNFNDMRLEELPDPRPGPTDVLVKVRAVQLSITEVLQFRGYQTTHHDYLREKIEREAPVQLFGHEFCGEVLECGSEVTEFKVGDRLSYGHPSGHILGIHVPGCLAQYAAVSTESLVKLPASMSDGEAAAYQPATTSVTAVDECGIRLGNTVAIFGQGVIGLNCLQAAKQSGAGRCIGVDVRSESLQLSEELGADHTVDAREVDPVQAIHDLTDGKGADVVIECAAGFPDMGLAGNTTYMQAVEATRASGMLMVISFSSGPVEMDYMVPRRKNLTMRWVGRPSKQILEHTATLIASGALKLQPLISHQLNGIEHVPEAIEITGNKAKHHATNPAQVLIV